MNLSKLFSSLILLLFTTQLFAQDSLITSLSKKNLTTFNKSNGSFSGAGWENIIKKIKASNDVLIGEDHFTNEIPYFTSAIASTAHFDNFFCEIDPFAANILQQKIKTLSPTALQDYVNTYGNAFSFYSYTAELDLLKQFSKSNTKIFGTDQILIVGDRVICSELQKTTKNPIAKKIYQAIAANSKIYFDRFLKDQSQTFYLLSDDFAKKIDTLSGLKLSTEETKIVDMLKLTAKIYKSRSHELRIQLMKSQLMEVYGNWQGKRNLFKYGANHVTKGESLLEIYDIGALVSNLNDANYKKSLHIMIMGLSGKHASPFEGFPDSEIDPNSNMLKKLMPITKTVEGQDWHCYDLVPLRTELNAGKLVVKDLTLQRIIKGYDLLVVIPKVSAAQFAKAK
ncbi:MAG: hypothetical protein EOO90_24280 [Pedobacter sp.]|nr:MAG: hypothetical protein EOO90_24280 [Pedobacter sp.]